MDRLLDRELRCLTVLDISAAALERARARLGPRAAAVRWIEADVTGDWSATPVDVWHDRAVFHFLTDPADRTRYLQHLRQLVKTPGHVVMATFALDGPPRCSGLPVERYSPETLAAQLGPGFQLVEELHEQHVTPQGVSQAFTWARFVRQAPDDRGRDGAGDGGDEAGRPEEPRG